jgi:hypothetical protein
MLGDKWEPASATIVAKEFKRGSAQSGAVYEYVADVQPDGGAAPFRAVIQEPRVFGAMDFMSPKEGAVVRAEANVKKGKARFDLSDPQLSATNVFAQEKSRFEGVRAEAVGVPAERPRVAVDPLDRLKKLAELHASGVLTDEEFAAQKAKILGS